MKKLLCVFSVLFAVSLLLADTGELNFSGEWQLNKEKSNFGESGRGSRMAATKMIISQKENLKTERFSLNRDGEEVTTEETLTLDGKECKNETTRGERISTANISEDGKNLTINTTMKMERQGNEFEMQIKEVWSLENDGDSLVIDYTTTTSRGERNRTLYYDKVKTEEK